MTDKEGLASDMSSYLGLGQTALTLAGAAGVTALARSLWTRARLADDEKFLAALASNKAARDRAKEIREAATIGGPGARAKMESLAQRLEDRAEQNLDQAIARAAWANSRQKNIGEGLLALGFSFFIISLYVYIADGGRELWMNVIGIPSALAALVGIFFLSAGKSWWIQTELDDTKSHRIKYGGSSW